jgi:hypothetical protein
VNGRNGEDGLKIALSIKLSLPIPHRPVSIEGPSKRMSRVAACANDNKGRPLRL